MSKTQMNYERGVNYKATPKACSLSSAEAGEETKQQVNYKCDVKAAKTSKPSNTRQMNFKNGS